MPRGWRLHRLTALAGLLGVLLSATVFADHVMITRNFSGLWEQPDHESQGLVIHITEAPDESKLAVVYWFTYAEDLEPFWFMGIGPVDGHSLQLTLYRASGIGFLQSDVETDVMVDAIGELLVEFRNCNQGHAYFDTSEEFIGSGDFRIQRLSSIYRMRCSDAAMDDDHPGGKPAQYSVRLVPARDDIAGSGKAKYQVRDNREDFKVEIENVPPALYELEVCDAIVGEFEVVEGLEGEENTGEIHFRAPLTDSHLELLFPVLGCPIRIIDDLGVALTSGDAVLALKGHGDDDEEEDDEEEEEEDSGGEGS